MKWNHEEKTIIPVKKPPRRDKVLYMPCFEFFTKSNHSTVPTPLTSTSDYATAKASYQCQDWFLSCEVEVSCSVESESLWTHGCSPPGSSVYRTLQTGNPEWVAFPFSGGSSQPKDWIWVSCIAGRFFTIWATRFFPYCTIITSLYSLCLAYCKHSTTF